MPSSSATVGEGTLFRTVVRRVRPFMLVRLHESCYHDISLNGLSSLDETYREYSPSTTDDLVTFWRSEVKGQGHSRPSRWRRHPRRCWGRRSPSSSCVLKSITHGKCDARPTVTFPVVESQHRLTVPGYTAWWQGNSDVNNFAWVVTLRSRAHTNLSWQWVDLSGLLGNGKKVKVPILVTEHWARSWSRCTGSQFAGDLSYSPGGRLPLLSARQVTLPAAAGHCPLAGTHFTVPRRVECSVDRLG